MDLMWIGCWILLFLFLGEISSRIKEAINAASETNQKLDTVINHLQRVGDETEEVSYILRGHERPKGERPSDFLK